MVGIIGPSHGNCALPNVSLPFTPAIGSTNHGNVADCGYPKCEYIDRHDNDMDEGNITTPVGNLHYGPLNSRRFGFEITDIPQLTYTLTLRINQTYSPYYLKFFVANVTEFDVTGFNQACLPVKDSPFNNIVT